MKLHFSHAFDGIVFAPPVPLCAGEAYVGPQKLLHWLEQQLGLSGYPGNTAYLRIELYRQSLMQAIAASRPDTLFFEASFEADRFAGAEVLLGWRDELLQGGWDFTLREDMPERLRHLALTETFFREKLADTTLQVQAFGVADRYVQVLQWLQERKVALDKLALYEPAELQVPVIQRIIAALAQQGIVVETIEQQPQAPAESWLGQFQQDLALSADEVPDGSLAIVRARRDADAATFLAQALRENQERYKPVFLIPEMNLLLEQSLVNEGFAPMGVLSASLARPSLQVLKLAPVFLWEPVDVFKVMEFVTLSVKPLDAGLAFEIARVLAEKPGLFSDNWFAAVYGYLEQAETPDEAREQYSFWFDRRRYPADGTAPKKDAIAIYAYLQQWALAQAESSSSLMLLAEQARRIRELLETLPENRIGFLELERIVRTIYEPSPMQLALAEAGGFKFAHQSGAIAVPVENLVWWNCIYENEAPLPEKWQGAERVYLDQQGVIRETPRSERQRRQMLQNRPLLQCARRLLLVIPEQVDGSEAIPSLLLSDLEAFFGERLAACTFDIDREADVLRFQQWLQTPPKTLERIRPALRPQPLLQLARPDLMADSTYETPTQLESLFYYPHRWFFRQKLKLYRSGLLSVTPDNTLLGNLAHRFFEKLMQEDFSALDRPGLQAWVDEQAPDLFFREGATLLLYGREPEKSAFLNRVKNAAWSLISLIRSNGWTVVHTEMDLEGSFAGVPVRGKADLVLQRDAEQAIVDLKWSGAKRRKELIQNGEDLQLVLYAHLLPPEGEWPHTAYFILDEGKMVARNNAAFKEAIIAGNSSAPDHAAACSAIFERMERTFRWRMEQLQKGQLELRTARTAEELEALYEGQLFDLLEMKEEDAKWDDYRILISGGGV